MFNDIATLIQIWRLLGRQRSACIDPNTKRHVQLWYAPNKNSILMQGTDPNKRLCPDVIFELDPLSKRLDRINCLWAEDQDSAHELIYNTLQFIVHRSFEKTVVDRVSKLPRQAWNDSVHNNLEFYSSPIDKDILWIRHTAARWRQWPVEVNLSEKTVTFDYSTEEPIPTRAGIMLAIEAMEKVNAKSK
ncbi:hypothetical protein RVBP21_2990 [Pseudomonas phage BRkr]|nr:hypothetical protein RVBP21_2990 [Pseudomonas phage BRkr]